MSFLFGKSLPTHPVSLKKGYKMEKMMRITIQDYLVDFCGVSLGKAGELAEGLDDYLSERGYDIVDKIERREHGSKKKE